MVLKASTSGFISQTSEWRERIECGFPFQRTIPPWVWEWGWGGWGKRNLSRDLWPPLACYDFWHVSPDRGCSVMLFLWLFKHLKNLLVGWFWDRNSGIPGWPWTQCIRQSNLLTLLSSPVNDEIVISHPCPCLCLCGYGAQTQAVTQLRQALCQMSNIPSFRSPIDLINV